MVQSMLALTILPPQGEKDTDITQSLLKNTKLVLNTKLQEKAFYAWKWDVPVPPHRALRIALLEVPMTPKRARALRVILRVPPQG